MCWGPGKFLVKKGAGIDSLPQCHLFLLFPSQAYVLNLPIGHKISNVARDAVKLGDFKWKLNELNKRRWKTWVI